MTSSDPCGERRVVGSLSRGGEARAPLGEGLFDLEKGTYEETPINSTRNACEYFCTQSAVALVEKFREYRGSKDFLHESARLYVCRCSFSSATPETCLRSSLLFYDAFHPLRIRSWPKNVRSKATPAHASSSSSSFGERAAKMRAKSRCICTE